MSLPGRRHYGCDVTGAQIVWSVHVLAERETSARRVLRRVAAVIDHSVDVRRVERYRKIPEQYVLEFETRIDAFSPAGAVFDTLVAAHRLNQGWLVNGPSQPEPGRWTVELVCAGNAHGRFVVPEVEWAHALLTYETTAAVFAEGDPPTRS